MKRVVFSEPRKRTKVIFARSLRQADFAAEILEEWIGTNRIERRLNTNEDEGADPLVEGLRHCALPAFEWPVRSARQASWVCPKCSVSASGLRATPLQ